MFELPIFNIIIAAVLSVAFSMIAVPSLLGIAETIKLFDKSNPRKSHKGEIPNLGGFAIFGAFIISYCIAGSFAEKEIKYIIAALCFVFMIGAKDDIVDLSPRKKFIGQFIAAALLVIIGGVRLTSFYGVLGISNLPYWASVVFSIVTIVFIVNAFNLIDGVNWLAGGLTIVSMGAFGSWFYIHGYYDYAIMAASIIGSIVVFLKYNYTPSKIFLGDSGSLSIGLLTAMLAIRFIEESAEARYSQADLPFLVISGPAMAIAILIIPIFDTLKVFALRIYNRKSPFEADKTHHHHKLLDLGFSHEKTSAILVSVNILFIIAVYYAQFLRSVILIFLIFLVAAILSFILYKIKPSKRSSINNSSHKEKAFELNEM
ncbi:MAG: undecaprenyl/decaprenyl-phosphate alpha-N-acetylglucosaminyl 1-phosphate transferase [Chitinophagales bacterium]|nr:undecaprenyl/decaprenyl-phosphate alpha-N-acetylglucosaminyl 1-phosphate transferase [Chitinophagales bacterium]MCZ2393957.1 undecaprenyl/decaprenyl-phosphate alpha-N-acetylglucosaminyl 1-phosphate transferase [Chitinophagales bacterium]